MKLFIIVLSSCFALIHAYPDGAPNCTVHEPSHGVPMAKAEDLLETLKVEKVSGTTGEYNVIIERDGEIRGILLRTGKGTNGTFVVAADDKNFQLKETDGVHCVTHKNKEPKQGTGKTAQTPVLNFVFKADNSSTAAPEFEVLIVEKFDTWWRANKFINQL